MSSTYSSLDAAAIDRKSRLAHLKSLKRKQPDSDSERYHSETNGVPKNHEQHDDKPASVAKQYTSGRNYDAETRGPKLGFENAPNEDQETLEDQAARLAVEAKRQADEEEKDEKPIDLFKLQPKKPNWDLKRDLAKKMEILNVRTDNAIARLVRERIEAAKKKGMSSDGEGAGIKGEELVEGVHVREREEEEELRREREEDGME